MNEQSFGNWWSLAKCPILESPEGEKDGGREGRMQWGIEGGRNWKCIWRNSSWKLPKFVNTYIHKHSDSRQYVSPKWGGQKNYTQRRCNPVPGNKAWREGEAGKSSNLSRGGKQAGWQGLSHHKSQVLLEGRDNIFQVLKKKSVTQRHTSWRKEREWRHSWKKGNEESVTSDPTLEEWMTEPL